MPNGIMLYNMKDKVITFENEMMRKIFKKPDQDIEEQPKVYSSWIYKMLIRQEQTDEEKKAMKGKRAKEKGASQNYKNKPRTFL